MMQETSMSVPLTTEEENRFTQEVEKNDYNSLSIRVLSFLSLPPYKRSVVGSSPASPVFEKKLLYLQSPQTIERSR